MSKSPKGDNPAHKPIAVIPTTDGNQGLYVRVKDRDPDGRKPLGGSGEHPALLDCELEPDPKGDAQNPRKQPLADPSLVKGAVVTHDVKSYLGRTLEDGRQLHLRHIALGRGSAELFSEAAIRAKDYRQQLREAKKAREQRTKSDLEYDEYVRDVFGGWDDCQLGDALRTPAPSLPEVPDCACAGTRCGQPGCMSSLGHDRRRRALGPTTTVKRLVDAGGIGVLVTTTRRHRTRDARGVREHIAAVKAFDRLLRMLGAYGGFWVAELKIDRDRSWRHKEGMWTPDELAEDLPRYVHGGPAHLHFHGVLVFDPAAIAIGGEVMLPFRHLQKLSSPRMLDPYWGRVDFQILKPRTRHVHLASGRTERIVIPEGQGAVGYLIGYLAGRNKEPLEAAWFHKHLRGAVDTTFLTGALRGGTKVLKTVVKTPATLRVDTWLHPGKLRVASAKTINAANRQSVSRSTGPLKGRWMLVRDAMRFDLRQMRAFRLAALLARRKGPLKPLARRALDDICSLYRSERTRSTNHGKKNWKTRKGAKP